MLLPQKLSNQELESQLKQLVQRERQLLHVILQHINEFATRKLYLERAYSSLYEYLTKELGYSGSAAMRRIEAARLLRDVPVVAQKIQEGTLNLSQIGELSRSIKEKESTTGLKVTELQKEGLVARIIGKTTLETQKELAVALDIPVKDFEKQKMQKDESVRLELTFTKEQYQKLLTCRDLAAHLLEKIHRDSSWASVFEVLADQYLARKGTAKNLSVNTKKVEEALEVFEKRLPWVDSSYNSNSNAVSNAVSDSDLNLNLNTNSDLDSASNSKSNSNSDSVPTSTFNYNLASQTHSKSKSERVSERTGKETSASVAHRSNKTLTCKTRKFILQRDSCCQYKDPKTGRQCRSTFGLQVDHRTSQWAGGNHSLENLQTLCRTHNRFKYQKEAGLRVT